MTATDIRLAAGRALDQLGLTADDGADRMRALGIKGEPKCDSACIVAVYLNRTVQDIVEVDVLETCAYLYTAAGSADAVIVDLPEPVQVLVHRFDSGVYLDLIQVDTAAVAR
jgi:hypothetical protein